MILISDATFAVSIKIDKETTTFNAYSIKLYNSKETLNTDKVNSMKNGIVYNKEYIDIENLKLGNTKTRKFFECGIQKV